MTGSQTIPCGHGNEPQGRVQGPAGQAGPLSGAGRPHGAVGTTGRDGALCTFGRAPVVSHGFGRCSINACRYSVSHPSLPWWWPQPFGASLLAPCQSRWCTTRVPCEPHVLWPYFLHKEAVLALLHTCCSLSSPSFSPRWAAWLTHPTALLVSSFCFFKDLLI